MLWILTGIVIFAVVVYFLPSNQEEREAIAKQQENARMTGTSTPTF